VKIRAELSGFDPVAQIIAVDEQDRQTVTLALTPIARASAPPPMAVHGPTSPARIKPMPARPAAKPAETEDADEIMK
jgi:hypothetical protein